MWVSINNKKFEGESTEIHFRSEKQGISKTDSEVNHFLDELKIGKTELIQNNLPKCEQASLVDLEVVDLDFEGKPFLLVKKAALAWRSMRDSAKSEEIVLEPFSGFRSYLYQKQLIKRKLDKGKSLQFILTEIAIPGFSEHHTGRAVDICTDGKHELEEHFEKSLAFEWLLKNADRFGFRLSYPRDNDKGVIYEPWHWCYSD